MRISAIVISLIWIAMSIVWVIKKPDYDSFGSLLCAAVALLSSFFLKKEKKDASQEQHISRNSTGIQAGGDIHIGSIDRKSGN